MTWQGHLLGWIPFLLLAIDACAVGAGIHWPCWLTLCAIPVAVYGLPVALLRAVQLITPLREGVSDLRTRRWSRWWAGHQLQALFIGIPWLETPLRVTPGAFSWWLRAWGSRIGRRVHWTPSVEILDRDLLEIGDDVIVGHRVVCIGHVIKPRDQRLILYVRRVRIGSGAFLSAGVRLGPGSRVETGSFVPVLTDLFPNQAWPRPQHGSCMRTDPDLAPVVPCTAELLP